MINSAFFKIFLTAKEIYWTMSLFSGGLPNTLIKFLVWGYIFLQNKPRLVMLLSVAILAIRPVILFFNWSFIWIVFWIYSVWHWTVPWLFRVIAQVVPPSNAAPTASNCLHVWKCDRKCRRMTFSVARSNCAMLLTSIACFMRYDFMSYHRSRHL